MAGRPSYRRLLGAVVLVVFPIGCSRKVVSGSLLDSYRGATCVAPLPESRQGEQPTRKWDAWLSLADGTRANILGSQSVGGAIEVRYSPSGVSVIAARSGDYVYPAEVRVSPNGAILYVKTAGLGAGIVRETWLFEYDLTSRSQLSRLQVDPTLLPPDCPVGQSKT